MITLDRYAAELARAVADITLLGQLPYDENDLIALSEAFRPLFADGLTEGLGHVGRGYDLPFALYLVLEGIYHYHGGDYWTGPRQALGLGHRFEPRVSDLFRGALHRVGLPTFSHIGGHAHIAPILAHAGIPNYCLDDFFALLDRAEREATSVDVATLMAAWAADGFPVSIDRPVQRFLLYGGDIAEEFVGRCLALWRESNLDPHLLDLPDRVLGAYERWQARQGARQRAQREIVFAASPRLTLDPYGEGVAVSLPPVVFQGGRAPVELLWRIEAGDRVRTEPTRRRQTGEAESTYTPGVAAVNVLTVAPRYVVTALADDVPLQAWTLAGPGAPPLLAFDAATGETLPDRQSDNHREYWLTPGERWLVFPHGWVTTTVGSRKLVELPDAGGDWAGYAFETWLLTADSQLTLTAPDGQQVAFCARNDPPPPRPTLEGAPLIAASTHERYSLYNGRPPDLHIPVGRAGHQPARWHIDIEPVGRSHPGRPCAYAFNALAHRYIILDDTLILPLDAQELLGSAPLGEFHIRLRGPYGRKATFALRFAPGLRFESPLCLEMSDAPTELRLYHRAGQTLSTAEPDIIISPPQLCSSGEVLRVISVQADLPRAALTLGEGATANGGTVELNLPVYRLRVGLLEPERPDAFQWATTPLRLHPEALADPHSAQLRVDLPSLPGAPPLSVGWRLVDTDGRVLQELPPRPGNRYPQTALAAWLDTFRHAGRLASLVLTMDDGAGLQRAVTVAHLLPTLELGDVITDWPALVERDALIIAWEMAAPARGRMLRLWPLDRPWVDRPLMLPVPDEATDWARWGPPAGGLPPGGLPLGEYVAEMIVVDPWDNSPPVRPALGAPGGSATPNVFTLRPNDMADALARARQRAGREGLPLEDALAAVLYLARVGVADGLGQFNLAVWRWHAALSPRQWLLWGDAVRTLDDSAYQILTRKMFAEERLGLVAQLGDNERAAYLSHLPAGLHLATYRTLLPLATGAPRRLCLAELCCAGDEAAYSAVLDDINTTVLDVAAAAEMLLPSAEHAADFLAARGNGAEALLRALLRRAPNDRFVARGSIWQTDVGPVTVTTIRNANDETHLDVCSTNGPYWLIGKVAADGLDIPVRIHLQKRVIEVMSRTVYCCQFSGQPPCHCVFNTPKQLRQHYRHVHRMDYSIVQEVTMPKIPLTQLAPLPSRKSP